MQTEATTAPSLDDQINDVMGRFNFQRALEVMHMTNWTWRGRTVTLDDMKSTAMELLDGAIRSYNETSKTNSMWSTGGFTARVENYPQGGRLSLTFALESVEAYMF